MGDCGIAAAPGRPSGTIARMSDPTHLLIAFAGASAPGAREALRPLPLPHLQTLLNRLRAAPPEAVDELSPEPPHERALARLLGLDAGPGCTPWAAHQLQHNGGAPGWDAWAWITPCHWKAGMDRVLMQDPASLALADGDSRTLLDAMTPFFAGDGLELRFEAPGRWLARGELFRDLVTASLDRVIGRDVTAWMPQSPRATALHRLQSEMQMLLYTHPVNDTRAEAGLAPVNSFWVSGAGALPADHAGGKPAPQSSPGGRGESNRNPLAPPIVASELREAALRQDWPAWARAWQQLDATHCAALLAALARGDAVRLTLCGESAYQTYEVAPQGFLQSISRFFGTKPASERLCLL